MVLVRGDVLRVRRLVYWHYGIYIDDNCIIHYSCSPNHWWEVKASVKITSLKGFLGKSTKSEIYYRDSDKSEKIIYNAFARLGEKEYSLFLNNCKHFAEHCISDFKVE